MGFIILNSKSTVDHHQKFILWLPLPQRGLQWHMTVGIGDDRGDDTRAVNSSKHLGGLQQQATLFLPYSTCRVRVSHCCDPINRTLGLSLMGRSHCGTEPHTLSLTASAQKRPMLDRPKQISRPLLSSTGQGHIIFPLTKISHRGAPELQINSNTVYLNKVASFAL